MNGKRRLLAALSAALLCMAGCSAAGEETPGVERELLCQFRDECRYLTGGGQYWEEKNPAWDHYLLVLEDQPGRPDEIRFSFTEDTDHVVFALDKDYQMLWERTYGSGSYGFEAADTIMAVAFEVPDGEPFHPTGTGMHPQLETPLTGRRVSLLGDSISAFSGYIPWADFAYYSSQDFGASSMWWAVMAENTGMEICNVNAVSGSGVIVPEEYSAYGPVVGNSDRCRRLDSRDGEAPDEIIILLGGNDYLHQIPVSRIEREYLAMLAKIRSAYPDARIHICTYFQCNALPSFLLKELNGMIRGIAKKADVGLIDLENCGILERDSAKYMLDEKLHPNERGQILLGTCAAQQLLESGAAA